MAKETPSEDGGSSPPVHRLKTLRVTTGRNGKRMHGCHRYPSAVIAGGRINFWPNWVTFGSGKTSARKVPLFLGGVEEGGRGGGGV